MKKQPQNERKRDTETTKKWNLEEWFVGDVFVPYGPVDRTISLLPKEKPAFEAYTKHVVVYNQREVRPGRVLGKEVNPLDRNLHRIEVYLPPDKPKIRTGYKDVALEDCVAVTASFRPSRTHVTKGELIIIGDPVKMSGTDYFEFGLGYIPAMVCQGHCRSLVMKDMKPDGRTFHLEEVVEVFAAPYELAPSGTTVGPVTVAASSGPWMMLSMSTFIKLPNFMEWTPLPGRQGSEMGAPVKVKKENPVELEEELFLLPNSGLVPSGRSSTPFARVTPAGRPSTGVRSETAPVAPIPFGTFKARPPPSEALKQRVASATKEAGPAAPLAAPILEIPDTVPIPAMNKVGLAMAQIPTTKLIPEKTPSPPVLNPLAPAPTIPADALRLRNAPVPLVTKSVMPFWHQKQYPMQAMTKDVSGELFGTDVQTSQQGFWNVQEGLSWRRPRRGAVVGMVLLVSVMVVALMLCTYHTYRPHQYHMLRATVNHHYRVHVYSDWYWQSSLQARAALFSKRLDRIGYVAATFFHNLNVREVLGEQYQSYWRWKEHPTLMVHLMLATWVVPALTMSLAKLRRGFYVECPSLSFVRYLHICYLDPNNAPTAQLTKDGDLRDPLSRLSLTQCTMRHVSRWMFFWCWTVQICRNIIVDENVIRALADRGNNVHVYRERWSTLHTNVASQKNHFSPDWSATEPVLYYQGVEYIISGDIVHSCTDLLCGYFEMQQLETLLTRRGFPQGSQ
jgi:hypothetical protein